MISKVVVELAVLHSQCGKESTGDWREQANPKQYYIQNIIHLKKTFKFEHDMLEMTKANNKKPKIRL